MPPTPPPSDWWVIVPFGDLLITDDAAPPGPFLFGDATMMSDQMVTQVYGDSNARDCWAEGAAIALRRRGVVNTEWFSEDRKNDVFMADARRRIGQIAALLSVALLATSPDGDLTGLPHQFHHVQDQFILKEPDSHRGLWVTSSGPAAETFGRALPKRRVFSRAALHTFLYQPLLKGLTDAISVHRSSLTRGLRQSIVQGCVRLASAFHAPSYAEQLLGAITSLELLLSDEHQPTSFAVKQQRLAMLLGDAFLNQYGYDVVITARHRYVHAGEDVTTRRLPLRAFAVAISALLVYAHLAQQHPTKPALLLYLDTIRQTRQLTRLNPALTIPMGDDIAAFRQQHPLPFLTYVDDTLEFDDEFDQGLYDRFDRIFEDPEDVNAFTRGLDPGADATILQGLA